MSLHDMPSIGTATGSRVDSAAKHIMACKVDSRLLGRWLENPNASDPTSYMHTNKMKFCMHKDEIVLNTTKKKNNQDTSAKAYPMVVSTVGEMQELTQYYIKCLYSNPTARLFFNCLDSGENAFATPSTGGLQIPEALDNGNKQIAFEQIRHLPEFRCQGVALGQAWASYMSGDTVASVLVGGMMTVLNGHFTMHTGDEVQWYFDFESDLFQHGSTANLANGFRLPGHTGDGIEDGKNLSNKRKKRDDFMDSRLFGTGGGYGKSMGVKNTRCVVRIKSYRMCKQGNMCFDHFGDKTRVFAKCISGGRPFDAVDIMLMTQSS
jgi:hypothetical protein